jgi:hypothetical protein
LSQLPLYDVRTRAAAVLQDPSRPWLLRAGASTLLASRQWAAGNAREAVETLTAFYAATPEQNQKALLERRLFAELHTTDPVSLRALLSAGTPETEKQYPHILFLLENARRASETPAGREEAKAAVEALREGAVLADPSLFSDWAVPAPDLRVTPLPGRSVALLLPMSGQYGNLAARIALGAEIARQEFAAAGHTVQVTVMDSDQPGWPEQLAALPPACGLVGGPMRVADYTEAKNRGFLSQRAFFSFLPLLSGNDEGAVAWRFFPSAEDQIQALLRLTGGLGITSYAVLMPEGDAYSERMVRLFEARVRQAGGNVVRTASYPMSRPETWNKLVASFLGTSKAASHPPSVPFRAIFLPDSWKTVETLAPNIFYFRERRQALLGTSLWEQELSGLKVPVDARYYDLTAFPGAWRLKAPTPAGEALQAALAAEGKGDADFWTGLGYDFIRFAATLDVNPGWTVSGVNAKLAARPDMAWSMAPIRWDAGGRAAQELFLFTPQPDGFAPVNPELFRRNFEKAWAEY